MDFQPGVVTFRPDNFLTVGLIGAVVYVAAVLLVQVAMRGGLLPATVPPRAPATAVV